MTNIQKKNKRWSGGEKLPIITDLVDPRPRQQVKFLKDYSLLMETATFSAGHSEGSRGAGQRWGYSSGSAHTMWFLFTKRTFP
jgi:hypothetical protein